MYWTRRGAETAPTPEPKVSKYVHFYLLGNSHILLRTHITHAPRSPLAKKKIEQNAADIANR